MTILNDYGMSKVVPKNFPKAVPLTCRDPALLYGVELEIENVPNAGDMVVPGIDVVRDGSLRNNGMEFITKPMSFSNLAYCLGTFFTKNKLTEANYSERCSIHVHTNVQDLESSQVQTIALLYQVVERILFRWIGHDREYNIFCVPLHQTNITYNKVGAGAEGFRDWEKYTALNFIPMFQQGTIEFRHMNGHPDYKKILVWCSIIGSLFSWARGNSFEDTKKTLVELNTSSAYDTLMFGVFGNLMDEFLPFKDYKSLLEEGVLDVKYSLINKDKPKNGTKKFFVPFDLPQQAPLRPNEWVQIDDMQREEPVAVADGFANPWGQPPQPEQVARQAEGLRAFQQQQLAMERERMRMIQRDGLIRPGVRNPLRAAPIPAPRLRNPEE